jgi:outer membrane receptor protein involved in Fe transport
VIFSRCQAITFWKLRASYATVSNALEPTFANPQPTFNMSFGNSANLPDLQRYPELTPKPELNRTFEVGTEFRMFNNRLNFDFTYYNSNVSNQYLTKVEAAPGLSKQSRTLIDMNAGKFRIPDLNLLYPMIFSKPLHSTGQLQ